MDDWFQRTRCCPEHPDQVPQEYNETSSSVTGETSSLVMDSDDNIPSSTEDIQPVTTEPVGATTESVTTTTEETDLNDHGTTTSEISNQDNNLLVEILGTEITGNNGQEIITEIAEVEELCVSELCATATLPDNIIETDDETDMISNISINSRPNELSFARKVTVHVDDGSMHGSASLFDEEELAQLASKIKTIHVAESPRSCGVDDT